MVELTPLVVSELVTDARKYAPGPVLMDVRLVGGWLEITVWDSDPGQPLPARSTPCAGTGCGGGGPG